MLKVLMSPAGQAAAMALVGVAVYKFTKKEATAAAEVAEKVVTEKLNPNSQENVVYGAVNGIGETLTGEDDFNLGHWIYDAWND